MGLAETLLSRHNPGIRKPCDLVGSDATGLDRDLHLIDLRRMNILQLFPVSMLLLSFPRRHI